MYAYNLDTLTILQEPSLEEMQKKALYISQDIIRGLQEIGEGTHHNNNNIIPCIATFDCVLHAWLPHNFSCDCRPVW